MNTIVKQRINVSVPTHLVQLLVKLAQHERIPTATKAAHLLASALEIEEDTALEAIVKKRDTKRSRFMSHKKVWG